MFYNLFSKSYFVHIFKGNVIQARDYLYLIILLYFALDVVVKKSKKIKNNNFTVQKVNSTILLSWPVAIEAATVVAMAVVVKKSKKILKIILLFKTVNNTILLFWAVVKVVKNSK